MRGEMNAGGDFGGNERDNDGMITLLQTRGGSFSFIFSFFFHLLTTSPLRALARRVQVYLIYIIKLLSSYILVSKDQSRPSTQPVSTGLDWSCVRLV